MLQGPVSRLVPRLSFGSIEDFTVPRKVKVAHETGWIFFKIHYMGPPSHSNTSCQPFLFNYLEVSRKVLGRTRNLKNKLQNSTRPTFQRLTQRIMKRAAFLVLKYRLLGLLRIPFVILFG